MKAVSLLQVIGQSPGLSAHEEMLHRLQICLDQECVAFPILTFHADALLEFILSNLEHDLARRK